MEQGLKTIRDILDMILNFLLVLCVEVVIGAVAGLDTIPVYLLCLPAAAPFLFYAARKWVGNLPLFLGIHAAVVGLLFYLGGFFPAPILWKIVYTAIGLIYAVYSIYVRVTPNRIVPGKKSVLGAAIVTIATFFFCDYVNSETGCVRVLWILFIWILGYLLEKYLENFLFYVSMNRKSAGVMPEKSIFQSGAAMVGAYSGICALLLILCSRTPLLSRLSEMVRWIGIRILRLFFGFLSLFGRESGETIQKAEEEVQQMEPMMEMGEIGEPSVLAEILNQVFITAASLAIIAGIVLFVVWLVRFLIRGFYGRKREKREIVREDFTEEEERLEIFKKQRTVKLPFIGGTPAQRVRRIFKKTVLEVWQKEEEDNPAAICAKTARELTAGPQKRGLMAGMEEGQEKPEAWDKLVSLYERARYTAEELTREDVKEAGKLSRQILHTIK